LAEQVLQKMKEKKEIEERNRPHYEVMKLEAIFAHEFQKYLKDEISILCQQVKKEEETLQMLEDHAQVNLALERNSIVQEKKIF
jgi:uncharacterized HAD superfamily protein